MCGILGIYYKESGGFESDRMQQDRAIYDDMLNMLQFRGPDEKNLIHFGSTFLGHTRLSIIDLATGGQPIFNEDKSIAVVLNGEIYNFIELRLQLEKRGHIFQSHSDTEVIVHLYEEVGEAVFSQLNGMFAVLIYDRRKNILLAARDRAGEKPLVFYETQEKYIFASELKAVIKDTSVKRELHTEAIAHYLNSLYVPAPLTIFKGIHKLPPAHYIKVEGYESRIIKYWDPIVAIEWDMREEDIRDNFITLFSDAVRRRIVSDVPIGVFLSGGIDSSAVVAFMARHCPGEVQTFCVGFGDEIDERPFARMAAECYRTKHTELYIDQKIEDVVLDVLGYYDEPFGDSSAIPTHMIAREARKHVKVILTGDGGDELFAGYDSYIDQKYQLWGRYSSRIFKGVNKLALRTSGHGLFERFYPHISGQHAINHWQRVRSFYDLVEIQAVLDVPRGTMQDYFTQHQWFNFRDRDALSRSYAHDLNYYLPDDLMKKVDMASMLASLECRAPFLDHRLIEFSFKIPPHLKVKNDQLKYVLKMSLKDYLPNEILYRRKTGFGAPVETWLRKQLRSMVCDYLIPNCRIEQVIKRRWIDKALADVYMVDRCSDYRVPYKLWLLFVLEVWMRAYA